MFDNSSEKCSWTGCERKSGATLAQRTLCLEHFLEYAHRRVESIEVAFEDGSSQRNLSPDVQKLLSEVTSQTMKLATETRLLAPIHRETLLSLSTRAAEIYKRIQRMPRIARRIPCRIRQGLASKEVEACFTVNVSEQGACVEVKQALKVAQLVFLERVDLPAKIVKAKVAWAKPLDTGRYAVGLAILEEQDFWGLGKRNKHKDGAAGLAS